MISNQSPNYELGIIKEYGDNELIVNVNNKDYHVLLSDEQAQLIETLLLEEDIEFVAFDIENESISFENVFEMMEIDNESLADIEEGVDDNGVAE